MDGRIILLELKPLLQPWTSLLEIGRNEFKKPPNAAVGSGKCEPGTRGSWWVAASSTQDALPIRASRHESRHDCLLLRTLFYAPYTDYSGCSTTVTVEWL